MKTAGLLLSQSESVKKQTLKMKVLITSRCHSLMANYQGTCIAITSKTFSTLRGGILLWSSYGISNDSFQSPRTSGIKVGSRHICIRLVVPDIVPVPALALTTLFVIVGSPKEPGKAL